MLLTLPNPLLWKTYFGGVCFINELNIGIMGIEIIILILLVIIGIFVWVGYIGKKKKAEKGDVDDQRSSKPGHRH
jgi:hypothetical protein